MSLQKFIQCIIKPKVVVTRDPPVRILDETIGVRPTRNTIVTFKGKPLLTFDQDGLDTFKL